MCSTDFEILKKILSTNLLIRFLIKKLFRVQQKRMFSLMSGMYILENLIYMPKRAGKNQLRKFNLMTFAQNFLYPLHSPA